MDAEEEPLAGGNATAGVVRVGDTVRKPWAASTPSVVRFVEAVAAAGVDVPRPLGRDERGRQVIEHVPGRLAMDSPPLTLDELGRVGAIVRAIHDAAQGFAPPAEARWERLLPAPEADLICHHDLAPWNLIVGERWVFIDWDGARPSTREWDLAYAAQTFTLNDADLPPERASPRLAALVDGYGADARLRERLPSAIVRRTAAMHDMLREAHAEGREPWGTMYVEGHGEHWRRAADYVERHVEVWARALMS